MTKRTAAIRRFALVLATLSLAANPLLSTIASALPGDIAGFKPPSEAGNWIPVCTGAGLVWINLDDPHGDRPADEDNAQLKHPCCIAGSQKDKLAVAHFIRLPAADLSGSHGAWCIDPDQPVLAGMGYRSPPTRGPPSA